MTPHRWRVQLTHLATWDLDDIHAYIAPRNPPAARELIRQLLKAVYSLQEFPERGSFDPYLTPKGRYRFVLCRRYRIIYRCIEDQVLVLRIWDSRRDPQNLRVE